MLYLVLDVKDIISVLVISDIREGEPLKEDRKLDTKEESDLNKETDEEGTFILSVILFYHFFDPNKRIYLSIRGR